MSLNLLVPCLDCGQDVAECDLGVFPCCDVAAVLARYSACQPGRTIAMNGLRENAANTHHHGDLVLCWF